MSVISTGTSLFRNALLVECVANIVGGTGFLLAPEQILSMMTHQSAPITPLSTSLLQWMGALVLALTTPLALSYPNTAAGVGSRATTYWTLGLGEVFLISLMGFQQLSGRSPFTGRFVVGAIAVLSPTLAWRVWCLVYRPEWMGSVREDRKTA